MSGWPATSDRAFILQLKTHSAFLSHLPYLDRESQVLERQVRLIWAHLSERKIESQNFRDL